MRLFGVQLVRPSFAMLTRAIACAIALWVAIIYAAKYFGMMTEPASVLAPVLIGCTLFVIGIDVFRNLRHLVVGLSLYLCLNMAVEALVLPLL